MKKVLLILFVFTSFSFCDSFSYYKKKFSNMQSYQVANFLYDFTKQDPYAKYAKKHKFGYTYNYRSKNGEYFVDFGVYDNDVVNITNYKNLNRFIKDIRFIIDKTICNEPIFRASLYSKTKLNFKIYDDRGSLQFKFTYSMHSSPPCTFY